MKKKMLNDDDGSEYDEDLNEVDENYIGVSNCMSLELINFESHGDSCSHTYVGIYRREI